VKKNTATNATSKQTNLDIIKYLLTNASSINIPGIQCSCGSNISPCRAVQTVVVDRTESLERLVVWAALEPGHMRQI